MRPRGRGLATVNEIPAEESPVLRRPQTGVGLRSRPVEDFERLPAQDRFEPSDLQRPYPRATNWDEPYEPPLQVSKSRSARTNEEAGMRPERTAPYKSKIYPPQGLKPAGQYEQLVGAFQSSMKELNMKMDRSFQQMAAKLYQMDKRLEGARDRVESVEERKEEKEDVEEDQRFSEAKRSFIHPPTTTAANTQTVANAEVQASAPPSKSLPTRIPPSQSPSYHSQPSKYPSQVPILREPEPVQSKDFETQTPADHSEDLQEEIIDQLTSVWLETLELLKNGNIKAAYRKILETGDDIYLLRLIHKTGVCLKDLDVTTGLTVLRRLGQIMHSNFLESLGLQWIEETVQKGVFYQLPNDVQKGLIQALYSISALPTDEGVAAAQLYTYLNSSSA